MPLVSVVRLPVAVCPWCRLYAYLQLYALGVGCTPTGSCVYALGVGLYAYLQLYALGVGCTPTCSCMPLVSLLYAYLQLLATQA